VFNIGFLNSDLGFAIWVHCLSLSSSSCMLSSSSTTTSSSTASPSRFASPRQVFTVWVRCRRHGLFVARRHRRRRFSSMRFPSTMLLSDFFISGLVLGICCGYGYFLKLQLQLFDYTFLRFPDLVQILLEMMMMKMVKMISLKD